MKDFNLLPLWQKIALILLGIIAIYFFVKFIYSSLIKIRNENLLNNSVYTGTTGGNVYQVDLGTKAASIYSAFYQNDWFGFSEDEEKAVQEIISVPKNIIPELSAIYFKLYGKNLKSDCLKYLSNSEWLKIADKFQ